MKIKTESRKELDELLASDSGLQLLENENRKEKDKETD